MVTKKTKKVEPDLSVYDNERLVSKHDKKQAAWPKVKKGSHLTVLTYEDGRTELQWDDEQLLKEVREAIATIKPVKPAVKAKSVKKVPDAMKRKPTEKAPAKKPVAKKAAAKKTTKGKTK